MFVDARPSRSATADRLGLDRVQLHGDEAPRLGHLDARIIRAVRVRDEASFKREAGLVARALPLRAFVDGSVAAA